MLDKSSVYNILAEEMYFFEKSHQISTFWTFHCLSEVAQIFHVIFETRSQILYKLCTIVSYLAKMECKWNFLETLVQSEQNSSIFY